MARSRATDPEPSGLNRPDRFPGRIVGAIAKKSVLEGAGRIFNVALSFAGARVLGPAAWGLYWGAFALAQWLGLATDLGGHLTLARDVAHAPRTAARTLATSLRLKASLAACALVVLLVATPWLPFPPSMLWPLAGGLFALSAVEWLGYFLRGRGRIVAESGLLAVDCVLACGCGVAALAAGAGAAGLALSQLVAHTGALVLAFWYVRRLAPPAAAAGPVAPFLARSLPTGLAILLSIGSWRLGMLLLARVGGVEAGYYAVAHRLLEAARFLPAITAAALFPSFARARPGHSPWIALTVLVPVTAVGCTLVSLSGLAPRLLTLLFGAAYTAAAPVLRVVIWALPCMTANAVLTHWLVARGRIRTNAALSGVHLVVHAAGLAWLVPSLGALGAAWALLGAEAALTAGTVFSVLGVQ